ncbi:hypothetical protein [Streptomyces sp. NPDC017991]|uniref:hypothetical protein n=1 Tax=Streptomyces sp. NPDC017991 TaxID=3365026 RepID=UPI0037B7AAAB
MAEGKSLAAAHGARIPFEDGSGFAVMESRLVHRPRNHLLLKGARNAAFDAPDDLDRVLRRELRRIQLGPHPIDGCLTATGLTLTPPTPPWKPH